MLAYLGAGLLVLTHALTPAVEDAEPTLRAVGANQSITGSPEVVVAVLDTGITAHPGLGWRVVNGRGVPGGAVLPGYDFVSDPWTANDGDGWDSDPTDPGDGVREADAASRPMCRARHSSWHGTNVAGTIGSLKLRERDFVGLATGVRILPVRIMGRCGGNTADVAAGILWAVGSPVPEVPSNPHPARVVNISLSGVSGRCPRALQTAIDVARELGAVVVVAAGSSNANTRDRTPANCDGVITVGAVDASGKRSPTSNFGHEVSISAPGGDMSRRETDGIYTTTNAGRYAAKRSKYGYYQGSSAAAPYVSAALALMAAASPESSAEELRTRIVSPHFLKPFKRGQCDPGPGLCGPGILEIQSVISELVESRALNQN
jgi:serine protease